MRGDPRDVHRLAQVVAVQDSIVRYWSIVDGISSSDLRDCVMSSCFIRIADKAFEGLEALSAGLEARRADGVARNRTTRHIVSNFVVEDRAANVMCVSGLLTVFSGYGDKPAELGAPSSIGDFSYECVRDVVDETWKISKLQGDIVLAGPDSPFRGSEGPMP